MSSRLRMFLFTSARPSTRMSRVCLATSRCSSPVFSIRVREALTLAARVARVSPDSSCGLILLLTLSRDSSISVSRAISLARVLLLERRLRRGGSPVGGVGGVGGLPTSSSSLSSRGSNLSLPWRS